METKISELTIADLCDQFKSGNIIINREYQRSSKVWPAAAKSYLIDTILSGYPIPKLAMYQKLDLVRRKAVREIVDGQQRTLTILDFYNDKLRLSGKTPYSGKTFSTLEEDQQRKFLEYGISIDLFVGATDNDIRQVFRRINSYNVPLNPQEQRHAKFQGRLKWLIVELAERNTEAMKNIGAFTETHISRMADMKFYSELIYAAMRGIDHAQDRKIDNLYEELDDVFPDEARISANFNAAIEAFAGCRDLHHTELCTPYVLYALLLAIWHRASPQPALSVTYEFVNHRPHLSDHDLEKLSRANEVLVTKVTFNELEKRFLESCEKATNRLNPRVDRFKYFCSILDTP